MSFDIHCVALRNGKSGVGDSEAARRVLDRVHLQFHEDDSYEIQFADGSHVALYAGGLSTNKEVFDGGMFVLHGGSWTPSVMQFIFDFAAAGRLAIFPQHPACVILPLEDLSVELPTGMAEDMQLLVISNGTQLGSALSSEHTR